jgi:hypothetical protein
LRTARQSGDDDHALEEKTPVFRTEKRRSPVTGLPYP